MFFNNNWTIIRHEITNINNVENAFIIGSIPVLRLENIIVVIVFVPGPLRKLVIIRSSRDSVKIKTQHESIEGIIIGRVTLNKICIWLAPRSLAASSMTVSHAFNVVLILMYE